MRRDAHCWAIVMNFGVRGDMTNVIALAKFYVNRFTGLGILTPGNLRYAIGLAGRCYNTVIFECAHVARERAPAMS